jgi:hypothetical protein
MSTSKNVVSMRFSLVYVEWTDAEHEGAWSAAEDETHHNLGVIYSIGWLIHKNKQRIVMASSVSSATLQIGNKQYIPTAQITKFKKLRQAG